MNESVKSRNDVWPVYASIFAVAWIIRLFYLAEMAGHPAFRFPLVDAGEYYRIARTWAEGTRSLPELSWQPWLYPIALAKLYTITGPSIWAAKLLQITIGSLTCVLTAALAYRLWPRPAIRWTGGIIAAFYGPLIHYDGELLAEPWAAIWMTLAAWLSFRIREQPGRLWVFALGAVGALCLFTRPPLIAGWLPAVFFAAWVYRKTEARQTLPPRAFAGLLMAGFSIVSLPMVSVVRTGTGEARLLPVTGGINLYIGNSAQPCETINIRPGHAWERLTLWPELHGARTPEEKDAFFRAAAWADIRAHPDIFAANLLAKTRMFFSSREIPRNIDVLVYREPSRIMRWTMGRAGNFGLPFGLLLGLAVIGCVMRHNVAVSVAIMIAGYAAAIVLVHVCDRYRIPVIPLFIALGSCGVMTWADAMSARRPRQLATLAFVMIAIGTATSMGGPFCAEQLNYRAEFFRIISVTADKNGARDIAAAYARKALDEDPCEAHAWNQLGLLEVRRGGYTAGRGYFEKAISCDPEIAPAWFNLGKLADRQGSAHDAIHFFEQGLRHAPAHLPAWIDLGDLYRKTGQPEKALMAYEEVLRIRPGFPPARQRIAALEQPVRINP